MDKSPVDKLWAETLKRYGYKDDAENKIIAEKVVDSQGIDSLTEYVENKILNFSELRGSGQDKKEKDRSGKVSKIFGNEKTGEALKIVKEGLTITRAALKTFLVAFVENSDTLGDLASLGFPGAGLIVVFVARIAGAALCVKGAHDQVQDLYNIMKSFVRRLNLLNDGLATVKESRDIEKYLEMVREVLSNMLQFCENTERKVRDRSSHFKDFFKAIFLGEDQELKRAYDCVVQSFDNLNHATVMQTLSTSLKTNNTTTETSKTVLNIYTMLKKFISESEEIRQNEAKKQSLRHDDSRRQSARTDRMQGDAPKSAATTSTTSLLASGFQSVALSLSSGAEPHVIRRLLALKDLRVQGTANWFHTTSEYTEFLKWDSGGVLSIEGDQGSGKSILAVSIFEDLYTRFQRQPKTSVAYFTFDSHIKELQLVPNMLTCCAAQVAMVDREYQQAIKDTTREYGKNKDSGWEPTYWEGLFEKPFRPDESRRLILVLDGIGYMESKRLAELMDYVNLVAFKQLQISFVLVGLDPKETGREVSSDNTTDTPGVVQEAGVQEKRPKYWNVRLGENNMDQIRHDVRLITTERIETFKNLKTLKMGRKKRIVDTISKNADTFSYIDHALRKLNATKSWSLISRDLEALPEKTEDLYKELLSQCKNSYHLKEQIAVMQFLTWLAYCQKESEPLGLESAQLLFDYIWRIVCPESPHGTLQLQEQVSGRLSRIITVTEDDFDESSPDDDGSTEGNLSDTGSEAMGDEARNSEGKVRKDDSVEQEQPTIVVCFQEISLRKYFRHHSSIADGASSADELRPTMADAHVMMVELATAILLDEKRPESSEPLQASADTGALEELKRAAAKCWMQQFCDAVRLNNAADNADIRAQLFAMFQSISESSTAIFCFENLVDIFSPELSYYSVFGPTQELEKEFLDTLHLIADQGQVKICLIAIARCHLRNWMFASDEYVTYRSLRFAHLALCHACPEEISGGIEDQLQNELLEDSFKSVVEWCVRDHDAPEYQERGPRHYLQLARVLDMANYLGSSLRTGMDGLRYNDIDASLQIELLFLTTRCAYYLWVYEQDELDRSDRPGRPDRLEDIADIFKIASEKIPEILESLEGADRLKKTIIGRMYKYKARLEAAYQDSRKYVIESIKQTVAAAPDSGFVPFNAVIEGFGADQMWESIVEVLFILENPLSNASNEKLFRLIHVAAKMCGKEIEILALYRQAVANPSQDGMSASSMRVAQANFERFVIGDARAIERAKRLLKKNILLPQTDNRTATESIGELADILFEEFRIAKTLTEKEAARAELERISQDLEQRLGFDHSRHLSPEYASLVIMRRQLGPARVFFEEAKELLSACKQGLSDGWYGNDISSFRQAGRILALLPECHEEALVALSLQCYNTANPEARRQHLICNMCEKMIEHGDEFYVCIYCATIDLCSSCYDRRQRHYQDENTTERRPYAEVCPWGHPHIKVDGLEMEDMASCKPKFESWLEGFDSKWASAWEKQFCENGEMI